MIIVIDFGSQFSQLIVKRIREFEVYSQIESPTITLDKIKQLSPNGIILSGSPYSIYEKSSPKIDVEIFNIKVPILGICYGMHFIVKYFGGDVKKSNKKEYGFASMYNSFSSKIFNGIQNPTTTWMSHGDSVEKLPSYFKIIGSTNNTMIAGIENRKKEIYGLQFHPEVDHTSEGKKIISNFLFKICKCNQNWTMKSLVKDSIEKIKNTIGDKKVILGLSGGIDSLTTAVLLEIAIGNNLTCIFIDNGLLRMNEYKKLKNKLNLYLKKKIIFIRAQNKFLKALTNIIDPEKKRKIIGNIFIKIFEAESKKIKDVKYLAQGTLYSDIIESHSISGSPTSTIKSHHNVGGLPNKMKLKLIEPLKYLFKDEVRLLAKEIGIDNDSIYRQPFPGPGLAIRIIGKITVKRLQILREADSILQEEIRLYGLYEKLWQAFIILIPIKTVGVMGDKRTYKNTAAIRAVTSFDAMSADWARLPYKLLRKISNRITNEVEGINRVVYDITSKPPATIEWE